MSEHQMEATTDVVFCEVHTGRETSLRCNRCGRPMCSECAVRTPVGYRCRECVREQQNVFYNSGQLDYVIAGVLAIVLGAIGAFFMSRFRFFFLSIIISPAIGAAIANIVHSAVGRRRGRYTWLVVGAGVVLGALLSVVFSFLNISWLIYVVLATGMAASQLRTPWLRIGR